MKMIILMICSSLMWSAEQDTNQKSQLKTKKNQCTLAIEGNEHTLGHTYALRIPDSSAKGEITRLIFLKKPLTKDQMNDEIAMIQAFHNDGQGGVYIDIKDDGTPISTRMKWNEYTAMWSSLDVSELHFEGRIEPTHIKGIVTTDPLLPIYGKDTKWSISATFDIKIEQGWTK